MIETQLSSHSDGEQSKAFCRGGVSWESSGSLESPSSILRSRPEATTTVSSPIEVKSTFDSDEGSSHRLFLRVRLCRIVCVMNLPLLTWRINAPQPVV